MARPRASRSTPTAICSSAARPTATSPPPTTGSARRRARPPWPSRTSPGRYATLAAPGGGHRCPFQGPARDVRRRRGRLGPEADRTGRLGKRVAVGRGRLGQGHARVGRHADARDGQRRARLRAGGHRHGDRDGRGRGWAVRHGDRIGHRRADPGPLRGARHPGHPDDRLVLDHEPAVLGPVPQRARLLLSRRPELRHRHARPRWPRFPDLHRGRPDRSVPAGGHPARVGPRVLRPIGATGRQTCRVLPRAGRDDRPLPERDVPHAVPRP